MGTILLAIVLVLSSSSSNSALYEMVTHGIECGNGYVIIIGVRVARIAPADPQKDLKNTNGATA